MKDIKDMTTEELKAFVIQANIEIKDRELTEAKLYENKLKDLIKIITEKNFDITVSSYDNFYEDYTRIYINNLDDCDILVN